MLTEAAVRNAKPTEKPYKLADGGGMYLLVQPNGSRYWRLKYRFGGKEKVLALGVYPDKRPWFLCPQCWQRCAVVYWGAPGGRYACRKCLRLAYLSEAEDLSSRLWRKQAKLENRLGEDWTRPKGMHHRTWERITERIIAIESRKDDLLFGAMSRLGMLDDLPGIFN